MNRRITRIFSFLLAFMMLFQFSMPAITSLAYHEEEKGVIKNSTNVIQGNEKISKDSNKAPPKLVEPVKLDETKLKSSFSGEDEVVPEVSERKDVLRVMSEQPSVSEADSSKIETISVDWLTPDAVKDDKEEELNLKWHDDYLQKVQLRINYALSGSYNYPAGAIQISIPKAIFLSLPMTNAEGNGYEKDIHLYPKNKTTSIKFDFVKMQAEKNKDNSPLKDAVFNLYKGQPGKGKMIPGDIKSNDAGKIEVVDLEVGDYYFVEKSSANDKLISKHYLNDANNKLTFKVGADANITFADTSFFKDNKNVVNYEKPEFRKDITGFPEDINQVVHNYDEDEAIPFDLKTYVPKDIKDYQEFKISDVPDKGVEIDKSTINVKVGETTLEKDKDYELVTEKLDGNKAFEVKLKISNELATKIAGKEIIVNYKAKITDKAEMNKVLENTAELNYNNGATADKIQDKEQIESYGKKFVKKDAGLWGTTLLGEGGLKDAHFRLEKENKGNWEIVERFKDVVSKEDGSFEIKGLKEGKYRLVETKAPEGFRLPDGDDAITEFTLDANSKDANNAAVNIKNSKDTPLPVTGLDAMGYTVVATVGLLGVAVVTKKKKEVNA